MLSKFSLFPFAFFFVDFFVFCRRVASSTLIHSVGMAVGMADWSSIVVSQDQLPYPVVQYIKCYGARLERRGFASVHLADTAKDISDVRPRRTHNMAMEEWLKLRRH